jgi:hypothetical protein
MDLAFRVHPASSDNAITPLRSGSTSDVHLRGEVAIPLGVGAGKYLRLSYEVASVELIYAGGICRILDGALYRAIDR